LRQTHSHLTVRTVLAMLALVAISGCAEPSLESLGERSSEWIGSLTNGVSFLPGEPHPVTVMNTP
jgi:hypothetical protein